MSTNDYLSRLLQSIHDTYPNMVDTHALSSILPSVLLALVARNTNIVFITPAVVELQKATVKILSTVFGVQTKRIRIRSLQSPQHLFMSLFVPSSPTPSSTSSQKRRPSHSYMSRSHSAPRPSSSQLTECSDSTVPQPLASSRLPRYKTDPLPQESGARYNIRLPQAVVISGLERAGKAAQLALADVLRTRRIVLESHGNGGSVWNLPDGFFVVFVSGLGDARERPAIHTSLLDHFSFSTTLTQTQSTPASSPRLRALPMSPPLPRPPLLPFDQIPRPDASGVAPSISHLTTALLTAARHHPELDSMFLTARCVRDAETLVSASGLVFRDGEGPAMITEAHVRRVVPPVLAHRLRVRDGPREQIMGILWEGAGVGRRREYTDDPEHNRRTVKEILAEILSEV